GPRDNIHLRILHMEGKNRIGNYQILKRLGEGGFGVTYKAEDITTGQEVMIKMYQHSEDAKEEITHLRKLIGRCGDHLLCPIDYIQLEGQNKIPMVVTEFIDGADLSHYIGKATKSFILTMTEQMLGALMALRDVGIAHRDIKPENMM